MEHPTRACVAELVTHRDGTSSRGSGYLVVDGWVLTAAHVVADAEAIGVWLGVPAELRTGDALPVDPAAVHLLEALDLALVPVPSRASPDGFVRPPLGALDRDTGVDAPAAAVGCPWSKLRPSPGRPGRTLRDVRWATGSIVGGSNVKTGTLELRVTDPPTHRAGTDRSAWEGMSGAAVFSAGHLVGVIGQHHTAEGPGVLTVRPLQLPEHSALGQQPDAVRRAWTGLLPQLAEGLPVVTPRTASTLAAEIAQEIAASLAPEVLVARDEDLDELDAFASGEDRWRWVQAEAFAGKTALLAWFALHHRDTVEVAACFLLERLQGSNTRGWALDALNEQLAALAGGRTYTPPPHAAHQLAAFHRLLVAAAEVARQRGHRLVLVIDGLDEYDPHADPLDSWLPDETGLPEGASLLAASRADVRIRLADSHPLRRHVRVLSASDAASGIRELAEEQLDAALAGQRTSNRVVGYLAAAGGGLVEQDLAELIGLEGTWVTEIRAALHDDLRRVVAAVPDPAGLSSHVLVFTHEAVRDAALSRFRDDLPPRRSELFAWADSYGRSSWPADTPAYLLTGYPRLLQDLLGSAHPPDPELTRRYVELLRDSHYRDLRRRREGWLLEYVKDRSFLAKVDPEQARSLCYEGFRTDFPNSYLRAQLLDLLVHELPRPAAPGPRTTEGRATLERIVDVLGEEPIDAEWLRAEYRKYPLTSRDPRAAALLLGMGMAGGPDEVDTMLEAIDATSGPLAWAAADALIRAGGGTLQTPTAASARARDLIIGRLLVGRATPTKAGRRRRLYVLCFLRSQEARALANAESESSDAQVVGWAVKLLSAIGPSEDDVARWLETLEWIAEGTARRPWTDEWTQKRLVRALDPALLSRTQLARARQCAHRLVSAHDREHSSRGVARTAPAAALDAALAAWARSLDRAARASSP